MRVIALKTLRDFIVQHPSSKPALLAWYEEAGKAKWQKPMDIKKQFAHELIGVTMDIQPIRTKTDYRNTLKEVSKLVELDPPLGSNDGDRLDILVTMVQAYEARHFSLDIPDPVDAIKFRMEQQGLKPKDLEPMIGRSNRVYEVLNRKRPLTLAMVRKLHAGLGISAECLINQ
jgi:HTH-type transcriptional regulator/antitoxin HigA